MPLKKVDGQRRLAAWVSQYSPRGTSSSVSWVATNIGSVETKTILVARTVLAELLFRTHQEAFLFPHTKVDYSILDGPGAHLTNGIFLGDTVARETFVTQFIQDISSAANISPSRVFVMEIAPGMIHHDWEVTH